MRDLNILVGSLDLSRSEGTLRQGLESRLLFDLPEHSFTCEKWRYRPTSRFH